MNDFDSNDFDVVDSEFNERTADELYEELMGDSEKSMDEFIYYYGRFYSIMSELTGTAMTLLTWLTFHSEVNSGRVFVQSLAQKDALKDLGITIGTYYKALTLLKEKGIIKGGGAKYYINPLISWKGTADKRQKFMKVYPRL